MHLLKRAAGLRPASLLNLLDLATLRLGQSNAGKQAVLTVMVTVACRISSGWRRHADQRGCKQCLKAHGGSFPVGWQYIGTPACPMPIYAPK